MITADLQRASTATMSSAKAHGGSFCAAYGCSKSKQVHKQIHFFPQIHDFRRIKNSKVYLSIFQLTDKAGFQVLTVNQASSGIDLEVE